jgi:hypothetical protein
MKVVDAPLFALGVDSVQDPSDKLLANSRFSVVTGYQGSVTPAKLARILAAGKLFSPVTYGGWRPNTLDPAHTIASLHALSIPAQVTVWLDLEAQPGPSSDIIAAVNRWGGSVKAAGYIPGLYVGAGQQLTTQELQALAVYRYWQGCSRLQDRNGNIAEPTSGFCGRQLYPNDQVIDGTDVDVDVYHQDFRGRVATVVTQS